MDTAARPGVAVSAIAAMAIGSAIAITPAVTGASHIPALTIVENQDVMLAGFIADFYNQWILDPISQAASATTQVVSTIPIVGPPAAEQLDILFTYAEEALSGTVYLADDLVTPLVNGQFWPLSGQPGNYLAGAFNSTLGWAQGLAASTVSFIQAEIDWFTGWIPNVPNAISSIGNAVYEAVQAIIAYVNPWAIYPGAAVSPPAAAAKMTAARASVTKRPTARAAASVTASADQGHRPSRAAGAAAAAKKSGRAAAAHAAAKSAR